MAAVVSVLLALTACRGAAADDREGVSLPVAGGDVVSAENFPRLDSSIRAVGATAIRVRYKSWSAITGAPTVVGGALFAPIGAPPRHGRTLVVVAHERAGADVGCAPSQSADLAGLAPIVRNYLQLGYAVAVPDYRGSGPGDGHVYLDNQTSGRTVLDIVRAARASLSDLGSVWVGFGVGEGAGALWAASESASEIPGEVLVGTAVVSPVVSVTDLVQRAAGRTLNDAQKLAYVWVLKGLEASSPGFEIDDYRRGGASQVWSSLGGCAGADDARKRALAAVSADDLVPVDDKARRRLLDIAARMDVPSRRALAPMIVYYGGRDTVADPATVHRAIRRACDSGSLIQEVSQPDRTDAEVDATPYLEWIGHRLSGDPLGRTCGSE
ncbi:lipase family protein [Gordonia phthalatica]|uniref:lipase family protein n=1 Tax=Gordonia phthalatica TaxID=1136941 RepID=UPI001D049B62|nr:lipase family protein [Gordonia phthalatica]